MNVSTNKLQILTAAAILIIISGGIAAYAQGQGPVFGGNAANLVAGADQVNSTNSTATSTGNSTSTSSSNSTSSSSVSSTTVTTTITSTSSTNTTTTANGTLCAPSAVHIGRIVLPIHATQSTTGGSITFADKSACYAAIRTVGGIFSVNVVLRHAEPVTQYRIVLVANGTSYTLGNLVTGPRGNGASLNQVLLKPGTYTVSLRIFDTSSNPGQSTLVMQSAQGIVVSPPFPTVSAQSNGAASG
jgi:hypothetical protein